ncbi:hypothetical protein N7453_003308 [Penicillium expansum]|nr:hypothetical protein N7453_003308 [Penicillium expansum]
MLTVPLGVGFGPSYTIPTSKPVSVSRASTFPETKVNTHHQTPAYQSYGPNIADAAFARTGATYGC